MAQKNSSSLSAINWNNCSVHHHWLPALDWTFEFFFIYNLFIYWAFIYVFYLIHILPTCIHLSIYLFINLIEEPNTWSPVWDNAYDKGTGCSDDVSCCYALWCTLLLYHCAKQVSVLTSCWPMTYMYIQPDVVSSTSPYDVLVRRKQAWCIYCMLKVYPVHIKLMRFCKFVPD